VDGGITNQNMLNVMLLTARTPQCILRGPETLLNVF
jgi:hypothetical protein